MQPRAGQASLEPLRIVAVVDGVGDGREEIIVVHRDDRSGLQGFGDHARVWQDVLPPGQRKEGVIAAAVLAQGRSVLLAEAAEEHDAFGFPAALQPALPSPALPSSEIRRGTSSSSRDGGSPRGWRSREGRSRHRTSHGRTLWPWRASRMLPSRDETSARSPAVTVWTRAQSLSVRLQE